MIQSRRPLLVTGAGGFIGSQVALALLEAGLDVAGVDRMGDDVDSPNRLKRIERLCGYSQFTCVKADCAHGDCIAALFRTHRFQQVVHLAAESSVQRSVESPADCLRSNIDGFLSILEGCRDVGVEHLVYASSAAVYGGNESQPCRETDPVGQPLTLYGASKRSNELMAHVYASMYGLPSTGLRFFNVYGPWCRPDATLYRFVRSIAAGEPIQIFNHGNHTRDFTYIDDIVQGVLRVLDCAPLAQGEVPYRMYNFGTGKAVGLMQFVNRIEEALGCTANLELVPMQQGDVIDSCADVSALRRETGYSPTTSIETGVARFVQWYKAEQCARADHGGAASTSVC